MQNLAGRLLSLVVVAIIGRILDRSAFGVIALATTVTSFAELFTNQGYGTFIAQTQELADEHLDTAFWLSVLIGVVLAGAIAMGAGPLAAAFAEPSVAPIVRWLSLSLVIRSLTVVPTGILVRTLRFKSLSLRGLVASFLGGIAGITAATSGLGTYSLVVQLLVGDLTSAVILWRAAGWRPRIRFFAGRVRELTRFGAPIFASTIVGFAVRRLDTVIVLNALGIVSLAVYSMAQRIVQVAMQILHKSYDNVVFSALSRMTDPARRERAFREAIELISVLCFPLYVGLAIVASPLTVGLLGGRWSDSSHVLSVLALSGVPVSLSIANGAAITSVAKTRYVLVLQALFGCVYFPLVFPLAPHGPAAAAAAYSIACAAMLPFEIGLVSRALSTRAVQYVRALVGAVIATAVMAGTMLLVAWWSRTRPGIVTLAMESVAGLAVYISAVRLFAPRTFANCTRIVRIAMERRSSSSRETQTR